MSTFRLAVLGNSVSFPPGDPLLGRASNAGDVLLVLGRVTSDALSALDSEGSRTVLVELGQECLGAITGENFGREGGKVVGFARYRNGADEASRVVELVVQPQTDRDSIAAAVALFESAGLVPVISNDTPGRIIDRLIRPYFNRALTALDRGLATPDMLDKALTLGLGFARGPVAVLEKAGLVEHFKVCSALHAALADPCYAPPRRARVAAILTGAAGDKGGCP